MTRETSELDVFPLPWTGHPLNILSSRQWICATKHPTSELVRTAFWISLNILILAWKYILQPLRVKVSFIPGLSPVKFPKGLPVWRWSKMYAPPSPRSLNILTNAFWALTQNSMLYKFLVIKLPHPSISVSDLPLEAASRCCIFSDSLEGPNDRKLGQLGDYVSDSTTPSLSLSSIFSTEIGGSCVPLIRPPNHHLHDSV
jgi:hypothetical protein